MFIIQGNFGSIGNYEAVCCQDSRLVHYWRDNDDRLLDVSPWFAGSPTESLIRSYPVHPWYRSVEFGACATGRPSLLQSNFGRKGNFELLVREGASIRHYWRDNDSGDLPWYTGALFGDSVESDPAMVQSNFGRLGNFEVVVREASRLRHYWRDNDSPSLEWHKGVLFGDNVDSAPAMIRSGFGSRGNFEVVVREGAALRHYWRDNDSVDLPWYKGAIFGSGAIGDPALIELPYGPSRRDFLVVVKSADGLSGFGRNGITGQWGSRGSFASCTTGGPALLCSSTFDGTNEYEIFAQHGTEFVQWIYILIPWPGCYVISPEVLLHAVVPRGLLPSQEQYDRFRKFQFLNLRNWRITDSGDESYNCIAWSLGITSGWIWPDDTAFHCDWQYIPLVDQVQMFDDLYASYGWTPCDNGQRTLGKRKIALYAYRSVVTHASRQDDNGDWHESKCGGMERIVHDKLQMQGEFCESYVDTTSPLDPLVTYQSYGQIIRYYEKEDPNANLDLA